jgi:hypothetical protein
MSPTRLALVPLLAPLAACHLSFSSHGVVVDGVRLTESHRETVAVETWPAGGLVIEAHQGDVEVLRGDGPTVLEVQVHERVPGAAHVRLVEGRLEAHALEGPCAIGDVTLRTSGEVDGLVVRTGLGDVRARDVTLRGDVELSTGMGDVEVRAAGSPRRVALATGLGDIEVERLSAGELVARSGMGDVVLVDLRGAGGRFSTGMGDIEFRRCELAQARAETGMGDVVTRGCAIAQREFSTGFGSVEGD